MTDKTLEFLAETLAAILPDSYFGKIIFLVIVGLFILTLAGRFKLEWIGKGLRYLWCRAMWCWRDRHVWEFVSRGEIHLDTNREYGTYVCRNCGKEKRLSGA